MLRDFVQSNREELISRTRAKVSASPSPSTPAVEPRDGVPPFLTQLSAALPPAAMPAPLPDAALRAVAAEHGRELLAEGRPITTAVDEYADLCDAILELAAERGATIGPEDLRALTGCVSAAIGEAVAEYGRAREEASSRQDLLRRRQTAHDLRNVVQTALLSFKVLEAGSPGASARAAAVLGRSLAAVRELADALVSGTGKRPGASPGGEPQARAPLP